MTSAGSDRRDAVKVCPACHERFPGDGLFCPNDGSPLLAAKGAPASGAETMTEGARESHPSSPEFETPSGRRDPYLGREILQHIEIRELVGIGAMGRVYRSFQKGIDRDVAVKILHRELSANPQLVSRFLREAKVASRLQHPNVVNVLLSGQLPDGALYIVMEYLHGQSLQGALASAGGSFELTRALHVALQLCDAVGEAHVQGIVHRDLKPENVMLGRRGQDSDFVKVLDFGIARLNWSEQSMATATGLIFGTARYISPEGAQGEKVGPSGDVYSVATMLYQMLAGRTPFEGDQAVGLLIQQIHEPPPPLRSHEIAREVPPSIADVVMRGLAKDPNARPDGARSFGRALVEAARASGVPADDYYARSLYAAPASGSARAVAAPRASDPGPPNAAPHPPSNSTRDLGGDAPVAGPTAKWTPPAAVQAKLAAIAEERKDRASSPRRDSNTSLSASVDPTLDDDDVHPPARKTDYVTPAPSVVGQGFSGTVRMPSAPSINAGPTGTLPLKNDVEPISERLLSGARASEARRSPSRPGSTPEHTNTRNSRPHEEEDGEPSRRGRTLGIVVLCFLVGVGGAVALHRLGAIPKLGGAPSATAPALEAHVARTRDAVERERWEEPRGENVKELVTTGLLRYPNEPRLLALRTQAAETLIRRAVSLKAARDLKEAARLARVASEIVPDNETTRALAAEYASELEASAPPLASVTPSPTAKPTTRPTGAVAPVTPTGAKVVLETTPAKPRIGQPVQLVARVTGTRAPVAEAAFVVVSASNPQGTRLVPVSDGGLFRAAFTFHEAGRYEVSFTGKADGNPIRSARPLSIESAATPPEPSTAPAGSVKWL